MPFLRYVVFVGGALVAMLFVADWIWPSAVPLPVKQAAAVVSPFEQTIRINSALRWPDRIEFDTTQPTIVPSPAPPVVAEAPPAPAAPIVADNSALDARAEIKPAAKPAAAPRRQARARHHNNYYAQPQPDYWGRPPAFASAGPSWSVNRW